jgi:hypothetical protein
MGFKKIKRTMKIGRNDPCLCGSGKKYKKCCLMRDERKPHETLAKFVGNGWIEAELAKVKLDGYNNMNPMNLARIDMHPLIKAIVGTQIKLRKSEQAGKTPVALGRDELLQDLLHENLTILESILDVVDLQPRLRNKDEFPKVEYELAIAAGYARMGYKPNFIKRSSGKRTGEFYVSYKQGNTVLIECKKKDITSPKEQKMTSWWEEFQHLIMEKLKAAKKSYGVGIYLPLDSEKKETHQVADEIEKLVNSDYQGGVDLLEGKYKVRLEIIKSSEQQEKFAYDASLGMSRILYDKRTDKIVESMKITGYFPSDFIEERVSGVISTLGDAYGQLEEDKPNIIYVDINIASMMPERASKIMAKLPSEIKNKLSRDYSKISAVVLTNLKLLGHSEIMGFHADEHVIYNENAKVKLPEGFKIYGDIAKGQSILADIGALFEK